MRFKIIKSAFLFGALFAFAFAGCGGVAGLPPLTSVSVEGTGKGTLIFSDPESGQTYVLRMAWREGGYDPDPDDGEVDLVHCSVVEEISANGVVLAAGYIPAISDERCAEVDGLRPFRGGLQSPVSAPVIEPGPVAVPASVDSGTGGDGTD